LGFLVVGMGSLRSIVERERVRWGKDGEGVGMITREMVGKELVRLGVRNGVEGQGQEDEESEMARMLDDKVGV
jgi:hypothetical protein